MKRMPFKMGMLLWAAILLTSNCFSRAQVSLLVVPHYATNSQIADAAEGMFPNVARYQTVYGSAEFPPYPVVITEIQWRPDADVGGPVTNCIITNIQINISTTTKNVDNLSPVFSQNTGTNDSIVFSGTLILGTSFATLSNGTTAFDINVPLQNSFTYDPSAGNLLIEVRNFTGGTANLRDNTTGSNSDSVSRIFSNDANAVTAAAIDSGGGAIQITYTLPSAPPIITTQPTNHVCSIGGTATFFVTAISTPSLSYQWYCGNLTNPISGATNSVMTLIDVQTNQAGIYFVQVTGPFGSTLSSNALLTVTGSPFIDKQPANQTALPSETATFTTVVSGVAPLNYQWYFNSTNLIPGATNATLIITNAQFDQLGFYSVQVVNAYGSITSSNALLTIGLIVPNYSATNQYHSADGSFNSIVREDGVYAASEFPSFPILISEIRFRPDFDAGVPFSVTLSNTLFSLSTTKASPDQLSPTFSQNIGSNNSVVFSGTLNISTESITLANGTKAFDIRVPFQTPFIYDSSQGNLLLDFRNFNGCTPSVGNFINIAGGTDGTSRLYTSDPNGISGFGDTGGYVLEIAYSPASVAPTITIQPTNKSIVAGDTVNFSVAVIGTPPFSYQWFFNDFDHPVSGGNSRSLTLTSVRTNEAGTYFVQVTNAFGVIQSLPALLTVTPAPLIVSQPANQIVSIGGTATFGVTAQGGPLTYQWFFNNTNALSNATNAILAITNVQVGQIGRYSVKVTSAYDSVYSSNAILSFGITVPNYAINFQSTNTLENTLVDILRIQTVYGTSHFPPYSILISELRWRPDVSVSSPLTDNVPDLQINLSTTTTNSDHLSSTFAKNSGTNDTVVFSGTATFVTSFTTLSNGTKAFDIALPLQTPFVYDPTKGNLLVDVRNFSGGSAGLYTAGLTTITDSVSRTYSANPSGTTASGTDTGAEAMQVIYIPAPLPPTISSQPTNRSVIVGGSTSFNVVAGPQPVTYQWFYNTNILLSDATNSSLVLTNIQLNQSGTYSIVVSNSYGATTSAIAVLTVSFPPVNVLMGSTNAMGGNLITIPVLIAANGNENTLSFSMNFNTQRLTYANADLGSGSADGLLLLNTNQAPNGRLGVTMQLPPGETFVPGTQEVVRVTFLSAIVAGTPVITPINFTNQPINRFVFDAQGAKLATNFINGSVTLAVSDFEGDVTPRQTGDRSLDIFDFTQVGRFVAGLDTITNAAEFQRADVAPKSTSGDGQLKVNDWVQAGRYGALIDAPTVIGGPTVPVVPTILTGGSRSMNIAGGIGVKGLNVTVPIVLQSQTNESGVGFSVNFDPTLLKYVSTTKGSAAGSASLLLNTNQAVSGTVGVLVALQSGNSFTNGIPQEVAKLTFMALNTTSNGTVAFVNGPVLLSISDPLANELPANYSNGVVTINPPPSLNAAFSGSNATLSWPVWAMGFNVQATGDLLNQPWTNVAYSAQTNGSNIIITLPSPSQGGFFRLQHP